MGGLSSSPDACAPSRAIMAGLLAAVVLQVAGTVGPMCCGDNFCCVLTPSRSLGCWGGNSFAVPAGVFKAVSCQGKAGVALGDDDTIAVCFGTEGYGVEGCETAAAAVSTTEGVVDASSSFWVRAGCGLRPLIRYPCRPLHPHTARGQMPGIVDPSAGDHRPLCRSPRSSLHPHLSHPHTYTHLHTHTHTHTHNAVTPTHLHTYTPTHLHTHTHTHNAVTPTHLHTPTHTHTHTQRPLCSVFNSS